MTDFDFFIGSWDVVNRRLGAPLSGRTDWDEFPGSSRSWTVFDGQANVDQITFPTKGFSGLTVRLFDPVREQWSLYWVNSRNGLLEPPVVGRFEDGVGEFYGDDQHEDTPIRVRFRWSGITPDSARWEQAFSADGEQTWETNWIMEFARTGD
jgi:hypothetical protein